VIVDEFKRVGFELGPGSGAHRYSVGVVYQGTDAAAKMLSVGDEVVSVDGQDLDALDAITADGLLSGTVGATRVIGCRASAGLLPAEHGRRRPGRRPHPGALKRGGGRL
jgi:hypothetical protein